MNKSEKIIICGKSGSGKDYLMKSLSKKGLVPSIKYTTRPKRSTEIDKVEYNFVNESEFKQSEMIVNQSFINKDGITWLYGISKSDFYQSQLFIMTPKEISQLDAIDRKKCFIVFLDIEKSIREERIVKRNDINDSVKRRLDADEIDFEKFENYDLKISDPDFDPDIVFSLMV